MDNKQYGEYVKSREKRSPIVKNCFNAFITGGTICLAGELLAFGYESAGASAEDAPLYVLLTLILLSGVFTGIGFYDKNSIMPVIVTGIVWAAVYLAIEFKRAKQIYSVTKNADL